MAVKQTSAPDMLADFRVSVKRAQPYKRADHAPRVAVPAISEAAQVTRGIHSKSGAPVLLVEDGSTQHALPLCAIGSAIAGGVITRDEVAALLS